MFKILIINVIVPLLIAALAAIIPYFIFSVGTVGVTMVTLTAFLCTFAYTVCYSIFSKLDSVGYSIFSKLDSASDSIFSRLDSGLETFNIASEWHAFKNEAEAMQYVIEQLPKCRLVLNTNIRFKGQTNTLETDEKRFGNVFDNLKKAIERFCGGDYYWEDIFNEETSVRAGQIQEELDEKYKNNYKPWQLNQEPNMPITNFIVLVGKEDFKSEVLVGWRGHDEVGSRPVMGTSNRSFVEYYRKYYEILKRNAKEIEANGESGV